MASRSSVFLASLLLSSVPLAARADDDLGRMGAYLGLAGTYALEDIEGVDADDSLGINTRAGYRFHRNFAAELQFEWNEGFDLDGPGDPEIETGVVTVNGKAFLATGRVQPYFLAGIGGMYAELDRDFGPEADDSGFAARLGGGAEFYITPQVAAVLEASYVFATGDVHEVDYGSFVWGVQYRF